MMEAAFMDRVDLGTSLDQGFYLLPQAVDMPLVLKIRSLCEQAFTDSFDDVRACSSRGHVYAARNLISRIPLVRTFWQSGVLIDYHREELGEEFGLVRVLFFDKPPDRSWALPWHKDTTIAVQDNSLPSTVFFRPTVKVGVPYVVAPDNLLRRMLTLRLHLDDRHRESRGNGTV